MFAIVEAYSHYLGGQARREQPYLAQLVVLINTREPAERTAVNDLNGLTAQYTVPGLPADGEPYELHYRF